jgi:glycosyltransferase involved in cell wall biosynthesis
LKILYLTPHVPNVTKARSYYHILGLLNAGHQITVATLTRSAADASHINSLRQKGINVIAEPLSKGQMAINAASILLSKKPLQSAIMVSKPLQKRIDQHLRTDAPDIIHVEHLRMAYYGLLLRANWPVVWDAVDHLTTLFQQTATWSTSPLWRLIARIEMPRLKSYEQWLTTQFSRTLVITRRDQQRFQQDNNPAASRVLIATAGLVPPSLSNMSRAQNTLAITGTLNYHPNVASVLYFVEKILPLIREKFPDVALRLVGAHPVPQIQALASAQITITGFVPSIHDELQQATIAITPVLYGTGLQYKVLEAFFAQTPVVATAVALQGYEVHDNEQVLSADQPAVFAAAVIRLLSDADLRTKIGTAGRHYAEQYHDLAVTTAHLVEIYQSVIDDHLRDKAINTRG